MPQPSARLAAVLAQVQAVPQAQDWRGDVGDRARLTQALAAVTDLRRGQLPPAELHLLQAELVEQRLLPLSRQAAQAARSGDAEAACGAHDFEQLTRGTLLQFGYLLAPPRRRREAADPAPGPAGSPAPSSRRGWKTRVPPPATPAPVAPASRAGHAAATAPATDAATPPPAMLELLRRTAVERMVARCEAARGHDAPARLAVAQAVLLDARAFVHGAWGGQDPQDGLRALYTPLQSLLADQQDACLQLLDRLTELRLPPPAPTGDEPG